MDHPIPIILYLEILIVTLLTFSILWVWRKWTYWDRLGIPNTGPFEQFLAYRRHQTTNDVEIEWYQKYGDVFGVYKNFKPVLIVGSIEHCKNILIRDFTNFRNHTPFHPIDHRLDANLFSYHNGDWKRLRGIVGPMFSPLKLRGMSESILHSIHTFITNISKLEHGSAISIKTHVLDLIAHALVSCTLGIKSDELTNNYSNYSQILVESKKLFGIFIASAGMFGTRFLDMTPLDYISKLTLDFVAQRREENVRTGMKHIDFLQGCVDAKYKGVMSDDEICGLVLSFFTFGFETTSNMMTAMFFYLATNQGVQSKLFEEISSLSEVNSDSVSGLKYLDAVTKETSRLWTATTRNDRICEKNYKLEGTNITIPAGMLVEIPVYAMQRNPKYFPDPHEFKPERYLGGGQNEHLNPLSILTFGAGPRQCIANRFITLFMKLTLSTTLLKFKTGPTPLTKLENVDRVKVLQLPNEVFVTLEQR